jgi:hypothetical protein
MAGLVPAIHVFARGKACPRANSTTSRAAHRPGDRDARHKAGDDRVGRIDRNILQAKLIAGTPQGNLAGRIDA